MATSVLAKGNLFDPVLVTDLFSKVRGKSTLSKLSARKPIAFRGNTIFVFDMENDISIIAENAPKPASSLGLEPKTITPIKVIYQARVSDEFMKASAEARISIIEAYNDGFAAKLAAGLDKMAFHGVNPATGEVSSHITSYFDKDVTKTVQYSAAEGGDAAIEEATQLLGDYAANGLALSRVFAGILAKETIDGTGVQKFPELSWGGNPNDLRGIKIDVNPTVGPADYAILGDFSAFRWGFADDVSFEIIEFGDPDGTGNDLKRFNQICLRSEAYLGFAVINPDAFARVLPAA